MKGTDAMLERIRTAQASGHSADYVLFDTWFSCPAQLLAAMMNTRAMRRLLHRKALIYFCKMKAIACYLSQFCIYLFQVKKGDACNENDQYQIRGFYLRRTGSDA